MDVLDTKQKKRKEKVKCEETTLLKSLELTFLRSKESTLLVKLKKKIAYRKFFHITSDNIIFFRF